MAAVFLPESPVCFQPVQTGGFPIAGESERVGFVGGFAVARFGFQYTDHA